jgi:hypothetical protein
MSLSMNFAILSTTTMAQNSERALRGLVQSFRSEKNGYVCMDGCLKFD